jgi:glutamine synthetase
LTTADQAVMFKHAVREIAAAHGLSATFMARCDEQLGGSSAHIHQSLAETTGANLFASDPAVLDRWLAGLLATMADLTALCCPTVNSYKRTIPGSFAPTTATWGEDNRTAALRVIRGEQAAHRIEHRLPGADANPYLAIAACLAGGMHGIDNDLLPPPPVTGNAHELDAESGLALPPDLGAAVDRLAESKLAADLLGAEFVAHFLAGRRAELAAAAAAITDWERLRYFELI